MAKVSTIKFIMGGIGTKYLSNGECKMAAADKTTKQIITFSCHLLLIHFLAKQNYFLPSSPK